MDRGHGSWARNPESLMIKLICVQWPAFQWILDHQTSAQIFHSKMTFDVTSFPDFCPIQPPEKS